MVQQSKFIANCIKDLGVSLTDQEQYTIKEIYNQMYDYDIQDEDIFVETINIDGSNRLVVIGYTDPYDQYLEHVFVIGEGIISYQQRRTGKVYFFGDKASSLSDWARDQILG